MQTVSKKTGEKGANAASNRKEVVRLREELAKERQRVQDLENANAGAAERIDAAIESVKAILDKQG
jgi:hypothetical protein